MREHGCGCEPSGMLASLKSLSVLTLRENSLASISLSTGSLYTAHPMLIFFEQPHAVAVLRERGDSCYLCCWCWTHVVEIACLAS